MTQPTMLPSVDAVAFTQEHTAFRRREDSELRKMRRKNSFFSPRNLLGMIVGTKGISAEYWTYLGLAFLFSPMIMFGVAKLLSDGFGISYPVGYTIALSALLPSALMGIFLYVNANKEMAAKRKAVANTRRAADRLHRKSRPVLTPEHVAVREKLEELFLLAPEDMWNDVRTTRADEVFALMLEDFSSADDVMRIVEERGIYTADGVRAVLSEMRQVAKPLQDGAL